MKPVKPSLLIKKEILDFSHMPQVDAEGQIARKRFVTDAPIGPQGTGTVNGSIPGIIEYKTTAGEFANAVQTCCGACKHHDVKAWRQFVAHATGPASTAEDRQTIQTLRGRILIDGVGIFNAKDELDIEATLMSFGICRVLSDWVEGVVGKNPMHWPVVPARDASCPTTAQVEGHTLQVVTPAEPFGLFRAKDLDAVKFGAARRDAVLFDAQGKGR